MHEFDIDGMTLVGSGYDRDVKTFRHVYKGHDYDQGLADLNWYEPKYILDIGANLGAFTIQSLYRYRKATIVSVEPNPRVLGCLVENIRRAYEHFWSVPKYAPDWRDRVQVIPKAVVRNAEAHRDMQLTMTEGHTGGGSILHHCPWEAHPAWTNEVRTPVATVETIGVSELVKERRPDILKIDCEGMEVEILEDLRDGNHLIWIDRIVGEWHGDGNRHLVGEILRRTHDVHLVRQPGMPIGLFHARRKQ